MNSKDSHFGLALPAMRDPVVASTLSVIPGLGQIYNLEPRKGMLFLGVGIINILMITTLACSHQLIGMLNSLSVELNIIPNKDISYALANFHPGSAALNVLLLLFISFIAYAMRDAHDTARLVRRNSIYSPVAMHLSEATSGSYLFHSVLMATLVLFAFFFLLPAPPQVQVTDIEFVNPQVESKKPIRESRKKASIKAEALKDPTLKNVVKNPASSHSGSSQPKPQQPVSKPQQVQRTQSEPAKPEPQQAKSEPTKAPTPEAPRSQPIAKPIQPPSPAVSTPNPLRPVLPTPMMKTSAPALPTTNPAPTALDPTKLLANLAPAAAPNKSPLPPSPSSIAVKSNQAPLLVASSISPAAIGGGPQPGIATSNSRATGLVPNIQEGIGRPTSRNPGGGPSGGKNGSKNTTDSGSGGPAPKSATDGPGTKGDLGKFIGMTPSVPSTKPGRDGDDDGPPGGRNPGEVGNPKNPTGIGRPQEQSQSVDFGPYMAMLQRRIKHAWFPPKDGASKRVLCRFVISKGGGLSGLKLSRGSGMAEADQAALRAVSNAAPFPPLPTGSPESVDIEFTFDYNVMGGSGTVMRRNF